MKKKRIFQLFFIFPAFILIFLHVIPAIHAGVRSFKKFTPGSSIFNSPGVGFSYYSDLFRLFIQKLFVITDVPAFAYRKIGIDKKSE